MGEGQKDTIGSRKNYTLEDIARELGVSKTTVSRALSGKGRIGRDTSKRVLEFAREHGYRPNVLAKGLAQSKTYNLGLVIPEENSDLSFFKECMNGIIEEASKYNYDIIIVIEKEGSRAQIRRLVENHKVDGMILTRTVVNSGMVDFLKEHKVPFVMVGPSEDMKVLSVDNPNREASRELTGILLMKGLRRLALIGGSRSHYVTESRKNGFVDAHRDKGLLVDERLIFMGVEDYRSAMRSVVQALSKGADGMICMDENISALVLGCLREKQVEVPAMMKLASMYDSRQMEQNIPPVTSLQFDTRGLGRQACTEMLKLLGEQVEEECTLNYQVILRESTK